MEVVETIKKTITLGEDDIQKILRKELNLPKSASIKIVIRPPWDHGDEATFGGIVIDFSVEEKREKI